MNYMPSQWLLIFYTYCFFGWIWESSYVSIKSKEWINRGFLHGPLIPIYGFGAVIILWLTLPFKENILYIYILGLIGASTLEYFTGDLMERTFKIRYWDYSNHKFNLNGHICLYVSLGWGLFSVLLVKILHQPVENIILQIPYQITEIIGLLLTILFVADTTYSVQSALDMKKILREITANNKLVTSLGLKLNEITSSVNTTLKDIQESIHGFESDILKNIPTFDKDDMSKESFEQLELLNKKVNLAIKKIQSQISSALSGRDHVQLSGILENLYELKSRLKAAELNVTSLKNKAYRTAANLHRKNPSAVSRDFEKAFQEIKAYIKSRNTKHNG